MQILRPPPGSGSGSQDEAPAPPRNRFLRFFFALLFLVTGMVVFFVGGLVVRNPELPNYLLDQIVARFRGASGPAKNAPRSKEYVSSADNLKPPPPPTTPEQYLNLMSYDERTLPPDERAAASVLNQTVMHLEEASFVRLTYQLAPIFNNQIIPGVAKLQPGDDVTQIRVAIKECHAKANEVAGI